MDINELLKDEDSKWNTAIDGLRFDLVNAVGSKLVRDLLQLHQTKCRAKI